MSDCVGLAVLLHAAKMLVSTCPLLILCALITKSEGSVSNDLTVRVLYIGGDSTPEAINQTRAAQHYINSNSVLPSGYRLEIIDGQSKVCYYRRRLAHCSHNTSISVSIITWGKINCTDYESQACTQGGCILFYGHITLNLKYLAVYYHNRSDNF